MGTILGFPGLASSSSSEASRQAIGIVGYGDIGRAVARRARAFGMKVLPGGHPFFELDNVLLSPHCADHTHDWLDQAVGFFMENFERFRRGEPLRNIVDKKRGY